MEVILAQTAGFCMGVRRAVDMVLEVSKRPTGKIVTYGPLIHNPQVLELLKLKGVEAISEPSASGEATVVIRAHGVSPQIREALESVSAAVCDATCPHVLRAQNVIKKNAAKGYFAVIVGDEGHAEVEGLLGCAGLHGAVVGDVSQVDLLPMNLKSVCVVAQTTQNCETFDAVCKALQERYSDVKVFNTICSATRDRQEEVRSISAQVDAMVIVGGRNSANTTRLAEIAQASGVQTYLVESEEDLDLEALSKCKKVGVTAGASTPYWMLDRVVETVRALPMEKRGRAFLAARELLLIFLKGNLLTALGAASVSYAVASLLFERFDPIFCAIAATYALSMHIFNSYADRHSAMFNEPFMARFYSRYGTGLQVLGVLAALVSLVLAASQGKLTFTIVALATFLGLLYCVPMTLKPWGLGWASRRLRRIPGSKDLFTAAAWVVVCVLEPFAAKPAVHLGALVIASIWTFVLVFNRSIAFDIKDLQGDRIVGKETIPLVLGKKGIKGMLLGLVLFQTLTLVWAASSGVVSDLGYWLLGSVAFECLYLWLYHRRIITRGIIFELVVDASLVVPALITFLWQMY